MKQTLLIIFCLLTLSSCSMNQLIAEIPNNEFAEFKYHRGGNVTSATLNAKGAKKTDEGIVIDDVSITADYGPFANFSIYIKGLVIGEGE